MKTKCLLSLILSFNFLLIEAQDIKKIAISTADLIYVAQKDRIYATVPNASADANYRNRLIVVNPYFGRIEASYFVGSDPTALAVTNDGKFLYIGLRGASNYVKFDLTTHTIANTFSVGNGANIRDPAYVEQIQTLPNSSTTVVISRRNSCCSPRHEGVAAYDEGVKRLENSPGHSGANTIAATNDSTLLWGYNNETTEFALRKLRLSTSGIAVEGIYSGLIDGFGSRIKYFDGRIYATTGAVIDVRSANPTKAGQFAITGFNGRDMVVDTAAAFYAMGGSPVKFVKYDKTTFTQVNEVAIPNLNGDVFKLIQWGDSYQSRFAFSTQEAIIIMGQCKSLIQIAPTISTPNGTSVCQKDSLKLSASGNFNNYIWSNGATGKEIFVRQAGLYSVAIVDSTGCQSPQSPSVQINVENQPFQPYISPNSNVSFCGGGSVRLSASTSNNNVVEWSNGATGFEIEVRQAGVYTCRVVSSGGCRSESSSPVSVVQRTDSVPPRPTIAITGDTSFCAGSGSVTLTANPQSANYRYNWSNGASTSTITLKDYYESATYSLRLVSVSGCESNPSVPVKIAINVAPTAPRVFVNGKLLASSEEIGNQWYLNGQLILGATQQFYTATQSGFYQVRVIRNNCPSPLSELANVVVGTKDLAETIVSMAPNPAKDELLLSLKDNNIHAFDIVDVQGMAHISRTVEPSQSTLYLEIGHLPKGIYIVNFKNKNGQMMGFKKLVKI